MMMKNLVPGDLVIYRKTKFSRLPGPRAANVRPSSCGDDYSYTVDKFWIVRDVRSDGVVVAETRRGKIHEVKCDDPSLRKAGWLARLLYRDRFNTLSARKETAQAVSGE